jgi:hypothetical protein
VLAACGVLLAAVALQGCSGDEPAPPPDASGEAGSTVRLPAPEPSLDEADLAACQAFLAAVPEVLAGQQRVATTDDAATWGDPAIELLCGVSAPEGFDPTAVPGEDDPSPCTVVSRVGWFVPADQVDGDSDAVLTAVTYEPRVAVLVPQAYLPEGSAAALAELAEPIRQTLRRSLRCG